MYKREPSSERSASAYTPDFGGVSLPVQRTENSIFGKAGRWSGQLPMEIHRGVHAHQLRRPCALGSREIFTKQAPDPRDRAAA